VSSEQLKLGMLFPPQGNVLEVAVQTAARVAQVIFDCWLGPRRSSDNIVALIRQHVYKPQYARFV
jgi:malate dehydrogenase (oxaloacetate-decarboxylating)(NADP+)